LLIAATQIPSDPEGETWDSPARPACPGVPWKPEFALGSAREAPPNPGPGQSTFANPFTPSQAPREAPYVPDMRVGSLGWGQRAEALEVTGRDATVFKFAGTSIGPGAMDET